ncbi:MAG: 16S rRNA (uracil(1498)-N(3))-methyltransferase [Sphingobacteriaceae bacterium]|nr:16S rRNA (uracil(1498)-N(3))-methyltransferase [Sphingobacteriaceae bacterium]
MHIFYTPDITDEHYSLNEEESNHCIRVLRLKVGMEVILVDGKGGYFNALIESFTKKNVILKVTKKQILYGKRNHHLHIAVAPTKNIDRLEWFLEKATEMGIDEITPLICERSERKIVKNDRLNKVITSAVKQSMQAYHPVLNEPINFLDFIKKKQADHLFIAHCEEGTEKEYIAKSLLPHQSVLILIGPEGDFSANEITQALAQNFKPITLGNTRLRTETAALSVCFEVNYLNR